MDKIIGILILAVGAFFLVNDKDESKTEPKVIDSVDDPVDEPEQDTRPRGIKNNNPGNIKISGSGWTGKVSPNTDGTFEQFDTAENGIRALAKLLVKYYADYNLLTVKDILDRYAPGVENDSVAYVDFVSNKMGVQPDDQLTFPNQLTALVNAIIKYENGINPYPFIVVSNGIQSAGVKLS